MNKAISMLRRGALGLLGGSLVLAGLVIPAPRPAWSQTEGILGEGVTRTVDDPEGQQAEIDRIKKQVEASPDNYRLQYELGNAYYDAGLREDARGAYEKAVELNPKYTEAWVNLGSVLSDLQLHDDAIEAFEKALGINPEDCKARSNLGNAYYAMGRYPDAMYEYKRAVDIDPKCYSALYNIGVAFADAGIFREAVNYWKKVVDIAPNTDAAKNALENIDILERFTKAPIPPQGGDPSSHER